MTKKKIEIKGIKLFYDGKEYKENDLYCSKQVYQCKLSDGSQYLVNSIEYSRKGHEEDDDVDITPIMFIPQPNGVVAKAPGLPTIIRSYDAEITKEHFSPDIERDGDNFKATYENGDYEIGVAVLVPSNLHEDFTF